MILSLSLQTTELNTLQCNKTFLTKDKIVILAAFPHEIKFNAYSHSVIRSAFTNAVKLNTCFTSQTHKDFYSRQQLKKVTLHVDPFHHYQFLLEL